MCCHFSVTVLSASCMICGKATSWSRHPCIPPCCLPCSIRGTSCGLHAKYVGTATPLRLLSHTELALRHLLLGGSRQRHQSGRLAPITCVSDWHCTVQRGHVLVIIARAADCVPTLCLPAAPRRVTGHIHFNLTHRRLPQSADRVVHGRTHHIVPVPDALQLHGHSSVLRLVTYVNVRVSSYLMLLEHNITNTVVRAATYFWLFTLIFDEIRQMLTNGVARWWSSTWNRWDLVCLHDSLGLCTEALRSTTSLPRRAFSCPCRRSKAHNWLACGLHAYVAQRTAVRKHIPGH